MKKLFLKSCIIILFLISPVYAGVSLDGVDDRIESNNVTLGSNLSSHSVSFWYKTSDTTICNAFGSKNDGSTLIFQMFLHTDDESTNKAGYLYYYHRADDGDACYEYTDGDTGIGDGEWHAILITADYPNQDYKFYVDGVVQASTLGDGCSSYVGTNLDYEWVIGAVNSRGTIAGFCNAEFTEFTVWTSELSAIDAELLAIKEKRIPLQVSPSTLFVHYPMDDEADGTSLDGDTFLDMVGTSNGTGNDGANNTGLTAKGEEVLSYPPY